METSGCSPVPLCFLCTHYRDDYRCTAYPGGIPFEIIASKVDHRKRFRGDHEIHFEPVSAEASVYARELFEMPDVGLRPARRGSRWMGVGSSDRDPA